MPRMDAREISPKVAGPEESIKSSDISLNRIWQSWLQEQLPRCEHFNRDSSLQTLIMVLLTVTPAAKLAIDKYCQIAALDSPKNDESSPDAASMSSLEVGSPIEHSDLVALSQHNIVHFKATGQTDSIRKSRLDILLKGAEVYRPPPPPKKEPVSLVETTHRRQAELMQVSKTPEYKALMHRLRQQEENRQYERMLNPPPAPETFGQRFPNSGFNFNPAISHGAPVADEVDDVTFADVNKQIILIINVLISIICCSVAIWMAARRWSVPQRLGLSFSGSTVVAVAEVAIYLGYIKRIKDAKSKEAKKAERKEIVDTWIIDKSAKPAAAENVRFRKGKLS